MGTQMDDEFPILDEENYSTWRIEMRLHIKTMGAAIWKASIGGSVPLKNKSNFAQNLKWLECDENSSIASVSSS